jgi:hypothetical protein
MGDEPPIKIGTWFPEGDMDGGQNKL